MVPKLAGADDAGSALAAMSQLGVRMYPSLKQAKQDDIVPGAVYFVRAEAGDKAGEAEHGAALQEMTDKARPPAVEVVVEHARARAVKYPSSSSLVLAAFNCIVFY